MIIPRFYYILRTHLFKFHINREIAVFLFLLLLGSSSAYATYTPFNTSVSGNIGIGSASPGQKLDVHGTVRATAFIGNGSGLTGLSGLNYWLNTAGTGNVGISTTNTVGIGTTSGIGAGLVVMNGNVGIGTWVPGQPLDVKGAAQIGLGDELQLSGDGFGNAFIDSANSGNLFLGFDGTSSVTLASSNPTGSTIGIGNDGSINILGGDNGSEADNAPPITITGADSAIPSGGLGGDVLITGGQAFGINRGGNVVLTGGTGTPNGNVGIGIDPPLYNLDVNGDIGDSTTGNLILQDQGGSVNTLNNVLDDGSGVLTVNSVTFPQNNIVNSNDDLTGFSMTRGGGSQWMLYRYGSAGNDRFCIGENGVGEPFCFSHGATGGMSVGLSYAGIAAPSGGAIIQGNVGIGSSAPGKALDVLGTVRATAFVGNGAGLTGIATGTNYWLNTAGTGNVGISTTTNTVGIGTTSGVGAGLVVMNGNVGIGTWAPGYETQGANETALSLDGAQAAVIELVSGQPNATGAGELSWVNRSNTSGNRGIGYIQMLMNQSGGNGGAHMQFATKDNGVTGIAKERMRIQSNGNVGIGSVTPGQVLDVTGTVRMTGFALSTNPTSGYVLTSNNIGLGTWMPSSSGISGLTTNYVTKASSSTAITNSIVYDTGTNVGISVTTPAQTLEVNGGMQIDGAGDSYFSSGNLGVGTTVPQAAFVVTNGNVGIGTWTASSGLQIKQSFAVYRTGGATTGNTAGQTIIGVNTSSSAQTITLATADTVAGRIIIIKDESGNSAANHITINTQSSQTIDGVSSVTITANYGVLKVYSDGANWFTF